MRYLILLPPPMWRTVILPLLFLPPDLLMETTSDFSGLAAVTSSNELTVFCLVPGVMGLNLLIAIYRSLR